MPSDIHNSQFESHQEQLATVRLQKQPVVKTGVYDKGRQEQAKIAEKRQEMVIPYFLRNGRYLHEGLGAGKSLEEKKEIINKIEFGNLFGTIRTTLFEKNDKKTFEKENPDYWGLSEFHDNCININKFFHRNVDKTDELVNNSYAAYEKIRDIYYKNGFGEKINAWCIKVKFPFIQEKSGPGESSGVHRVEPMINHDVIMGVKATECLKTITDLQNYYRVHRKADLEVRGNGKFEGLQHLWDNMNTIMNYQYYSDLSEVTLNDAIKSYQAIKEAGESSKYGQVLREFAKMQADEE